MDALTIKNLCYSYESDKRVIIDVAVRLAKKYCDKDDYKFVNAILDNLL